MNDPAIISGSLVDVRNVGVHKAVRLTIHVPAEYAMKVFEAFGWPTAVDPVAVAIARLHSLPQRPPAVEAAPQSAPTGQASPTGVDAPPPSNVRTASSAGAKSPAQIAGFLCTQVGFRYFLGEQYAEDWWECKKLFSDEVNPSEIAAEVVRLRCGVKSRSEITEDNPGWREIVSNFRAWEKAAEVVPA